MLDDAEMAACASRYLLCRPLVVAPLDPNFTPLVLAKRRYLEMLQDPCGDLTKQSPTMIKQTTLELV